MRFDIKKLEFDKIVTMIASYADTVIGKEKVFELSPMTVKEDIEKHLLETDEATGFIKERITPSFGGIYDLREALKRARIQGLLAIRDFLDIASHIEASKRIKKELYRLSERLEQPVSLEQYAEEIFILNELRKNILDVMNEQGEILSTASASLKSIRSDIEVTEKRIRSALDSVLKKDAKKLTEQIVTIRYNRHVVPVKISEKNNFKGTILDYSSSGETAYIEPETVRDLSSKKLRLEADEKKEIERILYQLTLHVYENYEMLTQNQTIIAYLDFVFAKAKYGYHTESVRPKIGKTIHLIKARHPLISKDEVVPNNITFDENIKTLVITGSNTGGKTVTLKTVGLLAIMMQSGCLIPTLPESSLPIFNQIRADIGDEQSIEQSLSTFSSHMSNIVSIVNNVTPHSLILLDELGSGTDPNEGSSLAMSILDYLDQKDVIVLATTHYPELKAYAYTKPSIMNASVEFDEVSLKPTYRLLLRTPGESHAFLISDRLGLNSTIIKAAQTRVLTTKTEISDLITTLRQEGKRLDQLIQSYEKLLKENLEEQSKVSQLKQTLQAERSKLKEKLALENQRVLDKLKEEALELIQNLETLKTKSFKEHELAELKYLARNLTAKTETAKSKLDHVYNVGDQVYLIKYNRYGELIKKQKNKQWLVKMGALNSVFKEEDFEYAEDQNQQTDKKPLSKAKAIKKSVPPELDLRGLRVHEAEDALQKYLDDCAVANMPFAGIIHGFGTLALRKMVHEQVKSHPLVKQFRDGEAGEGGQGVTIIYFT
jgi:DNA mismatch repair protein MutS2